MYNITYIVGRRYNMTNYQKADFLITADYARKHRTYMYTGCIIVNLGYDTWGYIFPCDTKVTVVSENTIIDYDHTDYNRLNRKTKYT